MTWKSVHRNCFFHVKAWHIPSHQLVMIFVLVAVVRCGYPTVIKIFWGGEGGGGGWTQSEEASADARIPNQGFGVDPA